MYFIQKKKIKYNKVSKTDNIDKKNVVLCTA